MSHEIVVDGECEGVAPTLDGNLHHDAFVDAKVGKRLQIIKIEAGDNCSMWCMGKQR